MAENNSSAPLKTAEGAYPALPEPVDHIAEADGFNVIGSVDVYTAEQMRAYAAQAVAAQAAPAAVAVPTRQFTDGTRTLRQDCISSIRDFANSTPEEGEEWDVWFAAAFDLLVARINAIFDEHATPAHPATEDSSAGDQATESVLIEGVAYTIPEPVALELLRLNIELQQAAEQAEPVANCYSDDDGDTWRDCPDDSDFVEGRQLGEEFELQASIRSWSETFRVTKVPDETSDDYEVEPVIVRTAPQAQPADALDAEIAKLKKTCQELGNMFHDQIVAQQAAWIEWQHGAGAEAGMQWIENGLCGPGHIPDEDEPYWTEAQAYFDANKSDPFPACYCGRPSNILWMGKGFCSDAHHDEHRAAMAAAQEGGA